MCLTKHLAPCLHEALNLFWQELFGSRHRSSHTLEAYKTDLRDFFSYLTQVKGWTTIERNDLSSLTIRDWRGFLSFLKEERRGASTLARKLSALRTFYKFLATHYSLKNDALYVLRLPRKPHLLPKPVAQSDAFAMLVSLENKDDWIFARDRALLGLLYGCGLRLSEALALKENADFFPSLIVYGKRGKYRAVPILPLVVEWIEYYKKLCPLLLIEARPKKDQALFLGVRGKPLHPRYVRHTLMQLRRKLGLSEKITPHAFRHACATQLLKAGAHLRHIQELLGHASLRTTQIYTDVTQEDILQHYKAAHPRESL